MAAMGFIQSQTNKIEEEVSTTLVPETFTHSIAFGQTGCGKTSSYIYPNLKKRLELGHGILLYDYKGKEHLSVKRLAQQAGRLDDVVEIGTPWGESINLIQTMDEDALDKFFDVILKHGEDAKYWQNSAKSLGQTILKIVKALEDFFIILDKINGTKTQRISGEKYWYYTQKNLLNLVKICRTFESLKKFISGLSFLETTLKELIVTSSQEIVKKGGDIQQYEALFIKLIMAKDNFCQVRLKNQNALDSVGEDSNENLTQNIMGSLTGPLLSLSQNEFFNIDNFNITEALNDGKIVIINAESLSNSTIESLNNTILYELSKRTSSNNINPISVFIDEVQRVVSKNTDLPIDVFREAKVDMFLATQNSSLLKAKLEEEKFDALMGNLTCKLYFQNSTDEELETEHDLSTLNSFEYIHSEDSYYTIHEAQAIFLTDEEKLKTEFTYQKKNSVIEKYLYQYKGKAIILKYDARLYKEKKIIVIDLHTKEEHILTSLNESETLHFQKEVDKLFLNTLKKYKNEIAAA